MTSALLCGNCSHALPAGSSGCAYCGAPVGAGVAPPPTAPDEFGSAGDSTGSNAFGASGRASGRRTSPLGDQFAGNPASVGSRLAALTIDVAVVALIAVVVAIVSGSIILTALAVVEAQVFLLVLQARTGLGVGNALLRLRVAAGEAPYSPGIGRAFVRTFISAAGSLVAGVGAWIVEASGVWDPSGARRSWADRAAGTVVVAVPRRAVPEATIAPSIVAAPLSPTVGFDLSDRVTLLPGATPPVLQPPTVIPAPPRGSVNLDTDTGGPDTGANTGTGAAASPVPVGSAPADVIPRIVSPGIASPGIVSPGVVSPGLVSPGVAGAGIAAGVEAETGAELLLIFDTGQRERLPVPVSVVLGRAPEAAEPGDRQIVVRDPEHTVSKTHARLEHSFSGTWITDNGSTNGTGLLDESGRGFRLPVGVRTHVEDGMRIQLGERVFTISRLLGGAS